MNATLIAIGKPTGVVRRTTATQVSTHSRINYLLRELGLDRQSWSQEYKERKNDRRLKQLCALYLPNQ